MRNILSLAFTLVVLTFVAALSGCATSKHKYAVAEKENMLQAAGFRILTASTPTQHQLIRTLPADRVSAVRRKGQIYFVYPVAAKDRLYVGSNSEYLAYQQAAQIPEEEALVKQEVESIDRSISSPGWEAPWGDWDAQ
jgi:hypothetical protein